MCNISSLTKPSVKRRLRSKTYGELFIVIHTAQAQSHCGYQEHAYKTLLKVKK